MVSDIIISGVRTGVQVAVAALVAWAANLGLDIDGQALEVFLFSVTTGLVTMGLNWLSGKIPVLGSILSLGLTKNTPSY